MLSLDLSPGWLFTFWQQPHSFCPRSRLSQVLLNRFSYFELSMNATSSLGMAEMTMILPLGLEGSGFWIPSSLLPPFIRFLMNAMEHLHCVEILLKEGHQSFYEHSQHFTWVYVHTFTLRNFLSRLQKHYLNTNEECFLWETCKKYIYIYSISSHMFYVSPFLSETMMVSASVKCHQ